MRVTLIDSPVANVANIARALRSAGADLDVTRDAGAVASSGKIVLPGVGSFRAAMESASVISFCSRNRRRWVSRKALV